MSKINDTELDWYKFFNVDPGCEYHWGKVYDRNCNPVGDQIIVFMSLFDIERFNERIGNLYQDGYLCDEGGIDCKWQGNCIAFDAIPVLEYFDLDPERVFPDKEG